jgi:hypothetical protein
MGKNVTGRRDTAEDYCGMIENSSIIYSYNLLVDYGVAQAAPPRPHEEEPVEDVWITRNELARRWRREAKTLADWASRGEGPRYAMIAGRALYRRDDVEAFEAGKFVEREHRPRSRGKKEAAAASP